MQKRRQQRSLDRTVCQASSNGKVPAKPRRVVVTGMGVVSSLGHDPDEFYSNLLQVGAWPAWLTSLQNGPGLS